MPRNQCAPSSTRVPALLAAALLMIAMACSGQIGSPPTGETSVLEWELRSNDNHTLRVQPGAPVAGVGVYLNADGLERLQMRLDRSAHLCSVTTRAGVTDEQPRCDDDNLKIPYRRVPVVRDGTLHVDVVDVYEQVVATVDSVADACVEDVFRDCTICSDGAALVQIDTCAAGDEPEPPADEIPAPPVDDPPPEPQPEPEVTPEQSCFEQGAGGAIDTVNGILVEAGLRPWDGNLAALDEEDENLRYANSYLYNMANCYTFYDESQTLYGPFGYEEDGAEIFRLGDEALRCTAIGHQTMFSACIGVAEACQTDDGYDSYRFGVQVAVAWWWQDGFRQRELSTCPPSDTDDQHVSSCDFYRAVHGGTVPADHYGEEEYPEGDEHGECVGSPLIVTRPGATLALTSPDEGVRFDLIGTGVPMQIGWVSEGELLTLDRNANGTIDDGSELFGEATVLTSGMIAADGFAALAEHDDVALGGNGDGRIDSSDAVYPLLQLWSDANQNGESEEGELRYLDEAGLASVNLRYGPARAGTFVDAGNEVVLESTVTWSDGALSGVYDVWWRMRSAMLALVD